MLFVSILPSLLCEVLPFLFSSVVRSNSLRFMVHVARVVLGRTHICHTTLPRFSSSSLFRWEAHLFQQQQLVWVCPPTANRNPQSIPINGFFCKFANHKPSLLTRFSSRPNLDHPNQDQGIDDASSTRQQGSGRSISCSILASWQLLEDRLPRENHESKKTVILFFGRGGIFHRSQENYQKTHVVIFWGNFCMSFKFQDDSTILLYIYYPC